ncbi:MAG: phosphate signaling complex protein PhoU [Ruminococcus sp.]
MREYFDIELANLNNQLIGMGTLVESAIRNAVEIIANNSSELLDKAREQEELINTSERKIQNHCIRLLLHQAPVANDLREVSSALKMITDLERIGDQAIDIAEVSQYIKSRNNVINVTHIDEMATQASKMVTLAIDAFVKKDFELAKKVSKSDDVIDELFDKVKKETVEIIQRDKALGEEAIDLMMIAKYLERIGDHAVNIAEWVAFSITGSRELGV